MFFDVKIDNVPVQLEVKNVGPALLSDINEFRKKLESGDLILINKSTINGEENESQHLSQEISESCKESQEISESCKESYKESCKESCNEVKVGDKESVSEIQSYNGAEENIGTNTSSSEVSSIQPIQQVQLIQESIQEHTPIQENSPIQEPIEPGINLSDIAESLIERIPDVVEDVQEIFEQNGKDNKKPWYKSKTILSNILAAIGCAVGAVVSDNPEVSVYIPASALAILNLVLRVVSKDSIKLSTKK